MPSLFRIIVILVVAVPLSLQAQYGAFRLDSPPNLLVPDRPWVPASLDNPRYPVRVRLLFQNSHFTGYGFKGTVDGRILSPQGNAVSFRYNCGRTFSTQNSPTYPARWLKPNKLQILMGDPDSDRTQKCTLSAHR